MLSVFALIMKRFLCCKNVSFGSLVIPRIFECFFIASIGLFNLSSRVVAYSAWSGVKSVVAVLSVLV